MSVINKLWFVGGVGLLTTVACDGADDSNTDGTPGGAGGTATTSGTTTGGNGPGGGPTGGGGEGGEGVGGIGGVGGVGGEPGTYQWSSRYGDDKLQSVHTLEIDGAGELVAMGRFAGTVAFGVDVLQPQIQGGSQEVFIARFGADGTPIRAVTIGASYTWDLATDTQNNVLMSGQATAAINFGGPAIPAFAGAYLVKFDSDGNHVFSQGWPGVIPLGEQYDNHITADANNNVLLAGQFSQANDFGDGMMTPTGFDFYIVKFDPTGALLWSTSFGAGNNQFVGDIATDAAGNIYLVGDYNGTFTMGLDTLTAGAAQSLFVAKLDPDGNPVWAQGFNAGVEAEMAIDVAANGDVVIGAAFAFEADLGGGPLAVEGGVDVLLARFDTDGNHIFSRSFGGAFEDELADLQIDADGNTVATGMFYGNADFGDQTLMSNFEDQYLVKLAPDGTTMWSQQFGDSQDQRGRALALDASGDIAIAASGYGDMDFGGGALVGEGNLDVFLHKRSK